MAANAPSPREKESPFMAGTSPRLGGLVSLTWSLVSLAFMVVAPVGAPGHCASPERGGDLLGERVVDEGRVVGAFGQFARALEEVLQAFKARL